MKNVAFIDCFINDPVNHCVNELVEKLQLVSTYHMPSKYGMESLTSLTKPTHYIILGSASHVHENLQWHKDLLEFIIPKIHSGAFVLGICFGHQLIAHHLGCEVGYIDSSKKTFDIVRDVVFNKSTLGHSKNESLSLAYSHAQVVKKITKDFDVLASSKDSMFDVLHLKKTNYYSLQAHPEASLSFIKKANAHDINLVQSNGLNFINSFLDLAK